MNEFSELGIDLSKRVSVALSAERLDGLLASLARISGIVDLRLLLSTVLEDACALLGAPLGSIGLVDSQRKVVRIWDARGLLKSAIDVDIPWGLGLAGEVAQTGRTIHLARYDLLPQPMFQNLLDHTVVGVPLLDREDGVLGYLGVGSPPPARFGEDDILIVEALGRQCSAALQVLFRIEELRREAVEEDRRIVAGYLHEGVRERLAIISGRVQMIEAAWEKGAQEGRRRTSEALNAVLEAIGHVKKLLRELRRSGGHPVGVLPVFLQKRLRARLSAGLSAALENLAEEPREKLRIDFINRNYIRQGAEIEEALLQIAQEAVTNVIRHSGAATATIILSQEGNLVDLKVIDDGIGFNPKTRPANREGDRSGIGLDGMREITEHLRGKLEVRNCPPRGTMVHVMLQGLDE